MAHQPGFTRYCDRSQLCHATASKEKGRISIISIISISIMLIESLEELREKGASGDASARKMCDLLDATREAIQTTKQSGEEPSATEYFSTLLTTLDARGSAMAIEIFSLLAVILPHTPDALVRSQLGKLFAAISAVLKVRALVHVCQLPVAVSHTTPAASRILLS